MSSKYSNMKTDPLSEEDLQMVRYMMQFFGENEKFLKMAAQVFKVWWLVPLGIVLAVSGSIGGIVNLVVEGAGIGQ